jgi:hypothetical protein
VKLSLLLRSLRNVLWRQEPVIHPERLKHHVDAEGRHHFELVLEAKEVEDDLPTWIGRPVTGLTSVSAASLEDQSAKKDDDERG